MHGSNPAAFLDNISGFLGAYYLALAAMNGVMALYQWQRKKDTTQALLWTAVAGAFVLLAPMAMSGNPDWVPKVPLVIREGINKITGPVVYSVGTMALLTVLFLGRRFFVRPMVAWSILNLTVLAMGMSMTDPNFAEIVTKPDNVPIVGLVFLLGFFTWLATSKAVENDDRLAKGLPPKESEDNEKVLVWPDLVYTELVCMIVITVVLLLWGIGLQAPLEDYSSPVKTPNPSKAPWYFLGLQEMLVYFDPWYAGVVLPSVVMFGLMSIPYLDFNRKGNGYFTIAERKFSYLVFQFGFLELWITLIVLGTFLRGPNWNFFGPFEYWDVHKVAALNNVNLSSYFWSDLLKTDLPRAPSGTSFGTQLGYILLRESPGIILVLAYLIVLPPLMAVTIFRKFFVKLGFIRYMLMANLLLLMMSLPLKMVLRWTVNLKYIIAIPEWFLNF